MMRMSRECSSDIFCIVLNTGSILQNMSAANMLLIEIRKNL